MFITYHHRIYWQPNCFYHVANIQMTSPIYRAFLYSVFNNSFKIIVTQAMILNVLYLQDEPRSNCVFRHTPPVRSVTERPMILVLMRRHRWKYWGCRNSHAHAYAFVCLGCFRCEWRAGGFPPRPFVQGPEGPTVHLNVWSFSANRSRTCRDQQACHERRAWTSNKIPFQ